jgi:hypothetical protein
MHWLAVDPPHAPSRRPPAVTDAVLEKKNANSIRQEFAHNIGSVSRLSNLSSAMDSCGTSNPGRAAGNFPAGYQETD